MIKFWLGTFQAVLPSYRQSAPCSMAIEVLREDDRFAVLFSLVDNVRNPTILECVLGFTNAVDACNVWHDRGFLLVDAAISLRSSDKGEVISVVSPSFRQSKVMDYEGTLVELSGLQLDPTTSTSAGSIPKGKYVQRFQAPDTAQPSLSLNRRAVTWSPRRRHVRCASNQTLKVDFGRSLRFPGAPLLDDQITLSSVWVGDLALPATFEANTEVTHVSVAKVLGDPAFRFEDVEVLGFRVDLAQFGRDFTEDLEALLEPLNFHVRKEHERTDYCPPIDFRYENAAPTLLIELLRYGRMTAKSPIPPLGPDDYQSQHELVVRLLVGRLDQDAARAYAPAVYVPVIFVDNPWSKLLGRDLFGFDKRMAQFCVPDRDPGKRPVRLRPDGRIPGQAGEPARPLVDISHIELADTTNQQGTTPLMDLDLSSVDLSTFDTLQGLNLNVPFGLSLLAMVRWRMMDFGSFTFQGPFAAQAVFESVRAFRCVQVAPVVDRQLEETWVSGKFVMDPDIRVGLPRGPAQLTLHALPSAEGMPVAASAWNKLCEMLGDGKTAQVKLPVGSWYRMLGSMELTIDDGLSWTT